MTTRTPARHPLRSGVDLVRGLLLGLLPLRVLLDLVHGLPGGGAVARGLTGLLGLGLLGLAVREVTRGAHPIRWPFTLLLLALALGVARSVVGPLETVGLALLYVGPVAYAVVVSRWLTEAEDPRRLLGGTAVVAVLPVTLSAFAWLTGDLGPELHGHRRLIGPYTSHHAHAVALTLFASLGAFFALRKEAAAVRPGAAALSVVSLALMGATWVRTTVLWVGLAVLAVLVLRRRWGLLLGLLGIGVAVVAASPVLQARFADVGSLLTGQPPEGGWGAVGSYRFLIWRDAVEQFVARGPVAWVLGLGLGAHQTLHRELDPHQEYLTLWFQLGLPGLGAYLWMLAVALRDAVRSAGREAGLARDVATLAVGLLVAVLLTNALSNDFLPRALLAFGVWGVCGLVWGAGPRTENGSAGRGGRLPP